MLAKHLLFILATAGFDWLLTAIFAPSGTSLNLQLARAIMAPVFPYLLCIWLPLVPLMFALKPYPDIDHRIDKVSQLLDFLLKQFLLFMPIPFLTIVALCFAFPGHIVHILFSGPLLSFLVLSPFYFFRYRRTFVHILPVAAILFWSYAAFVAIFCIEILIGNQ